MFAIVGVCCIHFYRGKRIGTLKNVCYNREFIIPEFAINEVYYMKDRKDVEHLERSGNSAARKYTKALKL